MAVGLIHALAMSISVTCSTTTLVTLNQRQKSPDSWHPLLTTVSQFPAHATMITRYLTSVTASFSPFSRSGKTARLFLSLLPSNARQMGVKVVTNIVPLPPKGVKGPESWVGVTFSEFPLAGV